MTGPLGAGVSIVGAYLLGAIPVGLLLARALGGPDLRKHGSRRIGATNALRTLGRPAAAVVLVLDVAKGAAAVLAARWLYQADAAGLQEWVAAGAGVAAVAGHIWSIFIGFRGGRGVATSGGAYVALVPLAVPLLALVLGAVIWRWRYVSLGSICAALAAPPLVAVLLALGLAEPSHLAFSVAIAGIVVAAHGDNVARLRAGTERRLGRREAA